VARLPDEMLERIKREISVQRLVEARGIKLKRVGKNLVESVITRRSADDMKLKKGDTVTAIIKSTEVMLQKD